MSASASVLATRIVFAALTDFRRTSRFLYHNRIECIHYHYNKTLFSKCLITVFICREMRRRLRLSCLLFQKAKRVDFDHPPRGAKRRQRRWGALPPLKGSRRLLNHQRFRQKHRHSIEEFHFWQTLHMRHNSRLWFY